MSEWDNAQNGIVKRRFSAVPHSIRLCYRRVIEILSSFEVELELFRSMKNDVEWVARTRKGSLFHSLGVLF